MQHTKTPWRLSTDSVRAPMATILADEPIPEVNGSNYTACDGGHMVAESIALRNAEFIVRACNAHDQLLTVARDFDKVLTELSAHCWCGEADCRTTRLRAAIAKGTGSAA